MILAIFYYNNLIKSTVSFSFYDLDKTILFCSTRSKYNLTFDAVGKELE
jgi:hypothetical protein